MPPCERRTREIRAGRWPDRAAAPATRPTRLRGWPPTRRPGSGPRPSFRQLEGELQVRRLVLRKRDRIVTGVARRAVGAAPLPDRREQAVEAEIAETVSPDVLPDFVDAVRGGDQFGPSRCVDAVEAGRHRGRTADAHVHFLRARGPDHLDDLPAGRPPDDRLVDQHDALAVEDAA